MTSQLKWTLPLWSVMAFLLLPLAAAAQNKERVFRSLQPKQIEDVFNDLNIKFVKSQPPKLTEDWDFDYEHKGLKIRLTLSKGKTLWVSASFGRSSLERINQWNINAKFSRAVLDRNSDQESSIIEWQLDVPGGVTDNMIRQFIQRFGEEVFNFAAFLRQA
jgi:Putative bacterial sensory transduction regulator